MPKDFPKAPPRNELSAIGGINERVVRYLESLSSAIQDATIQEGSGTPNNSVEANRSRMYLDLDSGDLYVNTSPEYGSKTGWQVV
jgi:hypothetical protein